MEFNKAKIQDLMNEWIIFRDEELCKLTKDDLKHSLNFDDFSNLVLKNVSKKSEKFILNNWTIFIIILWILLVIIMINIIELVLVIV